MRYVLFFGLVFSAVLLGGSPAGAQNAKIQVKVAILIAKPQAAPLLGPPAAEAILTDKEILARAKLTTDGPTLLKFFRRRTLVEAHRKEMMTLIRKLGDDAFVVREKASAALVELGPKAVPFLREVEKSNADTETLRRAERCRILIEGEAAPVVSAAAARLVAKTRPAGAAPVLLAYLPYAEDEDVADELRTALVAVAVRAGKTEPVLIQALADKHSVKRAAAAEVLCRAGVKDQLPAVHKLLQDKEASVRLRTALGLVPHKDKEAVAMLIRLVGELNADAATPATDLLFRLAGDQAPALDLGSDAASRQKCSAAWAAWWKTHADKIDLARASRPPVMLGYTLLAQRDLIWRGGQFQTGTVEELGPNKKSRWKIEKLNYPVDAQMIGDDRVLITEYQGRQVTERDLKGNIKWAKAINGFPLSAQRLANGNTFIVMQNQLVEVDKTGKEVFTLPRPNDVMKAVKLRNGEIGLITNQGTYTRLDPKTNKVLQNFAVGWVQMFGGMDVLPNGHVLIPQSQFNRVAEYNQDGKVVWQGFVQWPTSVSRLPNGQTLVASQSTNQVFVLNKRGKVVWQHNATGQVFQARCR